MVDIVSENEDGLEIWDKQKGESKMWFLRFQRYYLYRGLARSVRRAYSAFLQENYPTKFEDIIIAGKGYTTWLRAARKYNWKARAEAWDEMRNEELRKGILEASRFLMDNAMSAAEALVEALTSARLQVTAANSILDRVGLPSVSRQELLNVNVPVTADELAQMKEAVKEWEKSTYEESG